MARRAGDRAIFAAKVIEEYEPRIRVSGYWNVVGRLKDGVSIEQAQAEMDTLSAVIETMAEMYVIMYSVVYEKRPDHY